MKLINTIEEDGFWCADMGDDIGDYSSLELGRVGDDLLPLVREVVGVDRLQCASFDVAVHTDRVTGYEWKKYSVEDGQFVVIIFETDAHRDEGGGFMLEALIDDGEDRHLERSVVGPRENRMVIFDGANTPTCFHPLKVDKSVIYLLGRYREIVPVKVLNNGHGHANP